MTELSETSKIVAKKEARLSEQAIQTNLSPLFLGCFNHKYIYYCSNYVSSTKVGHYKSTAKIFPFFVVFVNI